MVEQSPSSLNLNSLRDFNEENPSENRCQNFEEFNQILNLNIEYPSVHNDSALHAFIEIDKGQYVLPCYVDKRWDDVLFYLKPISEGKSNLKEIYIALGYFIKTFGRPSQIQVELTEDKESGGNNKEEGLTTNLFLLNSFINKLNDGGKREIIDKVIPFIAKLVLKADQLCPILIQGKNEKINLTKEQCACLMAHMFMCVTLDQENPKLASLRNFSQLYTDTRSKFAWRAKMKMEKLKFIFNYFKRLMKEAGIPHREIIFNRLVYKDDYGPIDLDNWKICKEKLKKVKFIQSKAPERCEDVIQVSFSDKQVGDQTLSLGATQHQIMLLTHPELIISILLCETLQDKEALLVTGAEKFSTYQGYSDTFKFDQDYQDTCLIPDRPSFDREIISIDALDFKKNKNILQFSEDSISRELNKAYIGFLGDDSKRENNQRKDIWTGKWGCGVNEGNPQLKFIIQWIAASRANRELIFSLFGENEKTEEFETFAKHFQNEEIGAFLTQLLTHDSKLSEKANKTEELFNNLLAYNKTS